jgi:SAM-dependent methyltransferase
LTRDDRCHWERRYEAKSAQGLGAPSDFIVRHAALIRGRVLDIACGSGRNALFLARRGSEVDGVDIALAGLLRARDIARLEGLPVQLIQADLEQFTLPVARYGAIINVRYLQRTLFAQIERALEPGGVLLFETFLIDQMQFGHPRNTDFLLQRGELRAAFQTLEPIEYEEGLVVHEGGEAYLARLAACKPQIGA